MKSMMARFLTLSFLFGVAVVPILADSRQECIDFCEANEDACNGGGGTWHLDCDDVEGYWIEETNTCEIGTGPCIYS